MADQKTTPLRDGVYQTVSGPDERVVSDFIDNLIVDIPLDSEDETALMTRGWKNNQK